MPELELFDCNCTVGRASVPIPEQRLSTEELQEELAHAGVGHALAVHAFARDYDPLIGNEKMTELAQAHPAFVPCYVGLPHATGEMPGGDAFLRYLSDGGARAVRLYPKDHSYGLGETWCGSLFSILQEAGIPIFLDLDQTSWPEIDGILAHHPGLNLTLLRVGYRINRWLYPLLEQYSGLRIEPAFYTLHRGIETIARRFGPDRLIFGTGLPAWDAHAPVAYLQYAEIDAESRRQIAGETLDGLLWNGI